MSFSKQMVAAKHFQTGLHMVRQLEFSLFDFRLHIEFDPAKPASQVQEILDKVRHQVAAYQVPAFNRFQHSFFAYFRGSYAAGYYSYNGRKYYLQMLTRHLKSMDCLTLILACASWKTFWKLAVCATRWMHSWPFAAASRQ